MTISDNRILSDGPPVRQQAEPPKTKTHLRIERRIELSNLDYQVRILRNIASADQIREACESVRALNLRIAGGK